MLHSERTEKPHLSPTENREDTVTVLYGTREEGLPGLELAGVIRVESRPGDRNGVDGG